MSQGLPITTCSSVGSPEGLARLAALTALGGSPARLRHFVREHGPALQALRRGLLVPPPAAPLPEGVRVLAPGDAEWPPGFDALPEAPALVFAAGLPLGDGRRLAVVGARGADAYGLRATALLAGAAARAGWTVLSGGARGVDGAAHRAALVAGGRTEVVLGCGLAHPYPSEHRGLFDEVRRQGTLLTEYPVPARPRPGQFPERNRLVAAMADAVLVVQARQRSGALATARVARALGRPVLALPGDICYGLSSGTVALLATGAVAVAGPQHLLAVLDRLAAGGESLAELWPRDPEPEGERDMEGAASRWGFTPFVAGASEPDGVAPWLREALADGRSWAVDEIVAHSGRPTSEVLRAVACGELEGAIERLAGGRVRWTRSG